MSRSNAASRPVISFQKRHCLCSRCGSQTRAPKRSGNDTDIRERNASWTAVAKRSDDTAFERR
jgi:hypothetical protein